MSRTFTCDICGTHRWDTEEECQSCRIELACPYCHEKADLVDSEKIYGRSYGLVYLCESFDAYVGVHKGTKRPLGILANKETREARKKAHAKFDPIWLSGLASRKTAYKELARRLNVKEVYIGESDAETCEKISKISEEISKEWIAAEG